MKIVRRDQCGAYVAKFGLCCDDCGATGLDVVVEVGEERDFGSATACLCMACVRKFGSLCAPQEDVADSPDRQKVTGSH